MPVTPLVLPPLTSVLLFHLNGLAVSTGRHDPVSASNAILQNLAALAEDPPTNLSHKDRQSETEEPATVAQLRRDAAAFLAAIVESSDDPIISKSLDGIITTWNKWRND